MVSSIEEDMTWRWRGQKDWQAGELIWVRSWPGTTVLGLNRRVMIPWFYNNQIYTEGNGRPVRSGTLKSVSRSQIFTGLDKVEQCCVCSWIGGNLARCASRWRKNRAAYGRLMLLVLYWNAEKFLPLAINYFGRVMAPCPNSITMFDVVVVW